MRVSGTAAVVVSLMISPWAFGPGPATADMSARRAYDFVDSVGVNTHFSWQNTVYDSSYDEMRTALTDLGIKHVRQSASSPLSLKRLADLNGTLGVQALMVIDDFQAKNYRARGLDADAVPEQINTAIGKLGASAFSGVEGPNEYNATAQAGIADWAQNLRAYMTAIHQTVRNNPAASALPIVAPSLSRNDPAPFHEVGDLSSITDLGNLHAYRGERPLDASFDELLALAAIVNPGQPVVVTEYGLQTAINNWKAHPFTEKTKAKYLVRSMLALFSRPEVKRGFIYQLADTGDDPKLENPEMHFGLLRNDLSRTMAYHAVRNVMHLLCDSDAALSPRALHASLTGDMQNVRRVLLQKSSGVFYLVLWQDVASYEKPKPSNMMQHREWTAGARPLTLSFEEPVATVRTYLPTALDGDADAGKKPKATFDAPSTVALEVPDEVMVVEITPEGTRTPDDPSACAFTPGSR